MKKKNERAMDFLTENDSFFQCPICYQDLEAKNNGLVCPNHHEYDLSKKGTLFFLKKAVQTEYDKAMFLPRGRLIKAGMYAPILEKIMQLTRMHGNTLDVGCGEGSFLSELSKLGLDGIKIGFDISKDGVYEASNQPIFEDIFWCIADLTNLPFQADSFDTLLNIFSPSHYKEFQRVLKDSGKLIKVIPESDYLKELRQAFFPNETKKQHYSNEKVLTKLGEEMAILENKRITYAFDIPENLRQDLLVMSPLEWSADEKLKRQLQENPIKKITVDVRVIVANF